MGCVLDESDTYKAVCSRKVVSGRRVAGVIRSLDNAWSLQPERARVLHETLFVPVIAYGSETMIWKDNERSTIRDGQPQRFGGYQEMDKVPNARMREW